MPWRINSDPNTVERVVAGLSYLTFGMAGLIYLLLTKERAQSTQFRFHTFLAMFTWLLLVLFQWAASFMGHLLFPLFSFAGAFGTTMVTAVNGLFTLLGIVFYLVLLYGAVMAFLGKFAEVPLISNVVHRNMR